MAGLPNRAYCLRSHGAAIYAVYLHRVLDGRVLPVLSVKRSLISRFFYSESRLRSLFRKLAFRSPGGDVYILH